MFCLSIMLGVLLTQPELSGAVLPQASNLQVSPPISAAAHPDKLPLSVFALADTISAKAGSIHPMTTEYDEVLEDWQKGRQLSLKHNLFRLTRVDAGDRTAHQIVFTGEASGEAGEITMIFYTLDGDIVHVPPNHIRNAHVDEKRTAFSVSAIIPPYLRGRTGAIQITFSGAKRASFFIKVKF